jgi:hypothetical protein
MHTLPIIWPILLCAFLTGMLFAWVWFVALPRIRRVESQRSRARGTLRDAGVPPRPFEPSLVDADQQAIRRNV